MNLINNKQQFDSLLRLILTLKNVKTQPQIAKKDNSDHSKIKQQTEPVTRLVWHFKKIVTNLKPVLF